MSSFTPNDSTRRSFLKASLAAGVTAGISSEWLRAAEKEKLPPTRVITRGPKHHWFGYYDKFEFDPTDSYVLGMEVDFEHRSPKPDDQIKIGMVDITDGDKWIELGQTTAWGWQQGCMLQWLPGHESKVIWNDRAKDHYVSHILDVKSGEKRTLPAPIYSVSADGKWAVGTDFRRINDVRPGYGYTGFKDPQGYDLAPRDSGIYRLNLETGEQQSIISLYEVSQMGTIPDEKPGIKHYFNHLLADPAGKRFIFLHRWQYPEGHRKTRMLTANMDGSDIRIIDDNGLTSHFIWRDAENILAFSKHPSAGARFYLFNDSANPNPTPVGPDVLTRDGHCTYVPGNEWILNDTYPDKNRNQNPHLYHVKTGKRVSLGQFKSPRAYTGEWRCDTHPRISRNGKMVVIDSPHEDQGRQLHLIDISGIVG